MTPAKVRKLFSIKRDCVLVGFDGERWVDILSGPFDVILTSYYLTVPWNRFYIRLPSGAHYPKDYTKVSNERH